MSNAAWSQHIQGFDLGAEVLLYQIDLTRQNGPVLYLAPMSDPSRVDGKVSFGLQLYDPFPIMSDGFEWKGTGSPPAPTVTVSNVEHAFTSYVLAYDHLLGATFRRIRTFDRFLDTGSSPDGGSHQPIDVFRFDKKLNHNDEVIQWELAAPTDQQGVMLPGRLVLRDYCDLEYRRARSGVFDYSKATCPYTGTAKFTRTNQPTDDVNQDVCAHNLKACKLRHPKVNTPFGGFPGCAKYRV